MNFNLKKRNSNLPKASRYISPRDLEIFRLEIVNLQRVFEDMSRNVGSVSKIFKIWHWLWYKGLNLWVSHYTLYYQGQLKYYNARNVIGKGPRYNNPDKDITGLGNNFSSLIMMRWRCIGRYSFAKEHLMLSLWGIEQLPQWVKLYLSIK